MALVVAEFAKQVYKTGAQVARPTRFAKKDFSVNCIANST